MIHRFGAALRIYLCGLAVIWAFLAGSVSSCQAGSGWQPVGPFGGTVRSIAIDPTNSQTLYAAATGWGGSGILKSTNGGATWSPSGSPPSTQILAIAIDSTGRTLFAATGAGVFKSSDSGGSWSAANGGLPSGSPVQQILVDPTNSLLVYVTLYSGGVYKSTDGGSSWLPANAGLQSLSVYYLAIDPGNTQVLYLLAGAQVYRTTNGGANWTQLSPSRLITFTALVIDPTADATFYGSTYGGAVYKSTDGGSTWTNFTSGLTGHGFGLAIDPSDSKTIYAGTDDGVFKSVDGAAHWAAIRNGITNTYVTSLVLDKTNQSLYAATMGNGISKSVNGGGSWNSASGGLPAGSSVKVLAASSTGGTVYASAGTGGWASHDGGASWAQIAGGLPTGGVINYLTVDPNDDETVFAGTDSGIYRSSDGGTNWTAVNDGVPTPANVISFAIDAYGVVYAGTYENNSGIESGSILKSIDGGTTWTRLTSGANRVSSLAIDSTDNLTIYASQGNLIKSTDGGNNWEQLTIFMNTSVLAIDPGDNEVLYAADNASASIMMSVNGGYDWAPLSGGPANTVLNAIAIDPVDRTVYAGTGTGVWKFLTTSSPVITVPDGATCTVNAACSIVPSIVGWPAPTTAVSGSIPPGLGLDRATGILSGTPSLAGVYLLTLTATNGIPPDATRAVTLNVQPPPADALAVTISAPTGIAALQTLATISGTASGTELLKVEVAVTDGVYFLQGDGSFGVGENWLAASGTTSWSLDTSSVTWVAGVTYTVRVKVFSSGASYLVTTTFKMAQSPQKVATILVGSFTTTTPYIRVGDSVSITGSLRRGDANVPVVNQNVVVVVTSPAGVSSPLTPTPYVLQSDGTSGTFSTPPITFTQPGLYTFRIRFDGGGSYRASSTVLHLPVLPRSGYAIIVTGKATDQSLLALHTATTNAIYATLVQKRGFLPGDILQLTSTASTPVTKQQLQGAIIGWARDKLATAAAPLYLFMVDHGSQAGFVLNTETLSPDDLQGYLDALESDPAVAAAVAAYRRFVVIGTCYSGVFVDRISKPGRVVVTSTTGLEQSIAGISIYNSATAATLNGGEYFIDNLINFLGRGDSFRDAFATSRDMVALRDPRQVAPGAHADAYDTLAQHPLLDDLGDRKGSYLLDGTPQGSFSSGQQLGVGIRVPGNPADITAVTETSILSTQDAGSLPLWLTVNDSSHMARAWVEIRTPVTSVSSNGGTGQVIPHLITMPLYYDGARWQGGYSFPEPGSYDILYYSQDNQTGDVSPMVHGRVYRQLSGDTAPQSFTLTYPKDQATVAQQFTLFWNPALSANKVSYTLLVMKQDGTTVYKKEGIPQPGSYLTADDLKDPASNVGGYYCQNGASYCSWKVQAIDSYGAITESATGSFTILPASEPALVLGTVTDATTGVPLAGATIGDVNGARAITLANGYFVFAADAGNNYTLSADAGGSYLPASSSVTTAPGTVTTVNFSLSPAPVNGTCGTGSGEAYSSAPTSNLCASGTLSAAPSGGGPWNWSCYGSYGGASAYCTALMTQSITVTTAAPGSAEYHSQFSVAATAPGGTVSCSSGSPTVCTNSGGTFTMIAASGTCLVRYDQGGSASYEPAARVTGSVSAVKGSQAIGLVTFNPATLSTGGTATVGASSSSGQGVIFTSTTPSVCTVSGSTVTALGAGTCTIAADQGGDANYDAATQVIQSLDVGVGVQAITGFTPPGTKNFGDAPISLAATGGGSGNPVTFSVASGPGNLSGTNNATLTITGAGTIMVKASQGGSANYAAAPDVSQTITVTKAVLTVTADNQSRAANSANSPLTASYSGFVNADTASVLSGAPGISTSATFSSPAGSYPIIVAQGSLTSSNYSFGFVNGTLTVTQEFPATHAVTGSNSGSGGIRCESPVNDGSTSSCTLTPAVGYRVSSVSGCGSGTWNGSNYTTGAITGDCTVSATFAPVKPGDCDADGVVTIAEVQSAINMSLGMKAVAACVDTDGNGTVGIAEVQKVIDAFLGL